MPLHPWSLAYRQPTPALVQEALGKLRRVERGESGRSAGGEPIRYARFGRGRARVAVVAGLRGYDYAAVSAALLAAMLLDGARPRPTFLDPEWVGERVNLLIVPLANPDGLERAAEHPEAWREGLLLREAEVNEHYVYPHGDWMALREPEASGLHALLKQFKPHLTLILVEDEVEEPVATTVSVEWVGPCIRARGAWAAATIRRAASPVAEVAVAEARGYADPASIEVHLALEGRPVVVLATPLSGSSDYPERVAVHLQAILGVAASAAAEAEWLARVEEEWRRWDALIGEENRGRFRVTGDNVDEARRILDAHGVAWRWAGRGVAVDVPNRGVSATAAILLDEGCAYNRWLEENWIGARTLDRLVDGVTVEKLER